MIKSIWKWGKASKKKLEFLHDDLYFFFTMVLTYTSTVDISIVQVLRSDEEHQANLKSGASRVKVSRHLGRYAKYLPKFPRKRKIQVQRLISHAVDIVAWSGGRRRTDIASYYKVAEAARLVAVKYDLPVIWGGCWRDLRKISCIKTAVDDYVKQCEKEKRKPFLDLGHYELSKTAYPGLRKAPKLE